MEAGFLAPTSTPTLPPRRWSPLASMAWTTSYLLSQRSTETYIRPPQTVFRPHFAMRWNMAQ